MALTQEEIQVKSAALTLILDGLAPNELYEILLGAGVYAPAVSSTHHVLGVLSKAMKLPPDEGPPFVDALLSEISRETIGIVADLLRDNDKLGQVLARALRRGPR